MSAQKGSASVGGVNDCLFCGRYVLQVPGWTSRVEGYQMLRSPWEGQEAFLVGPFHFACLRASPHRERLRADLLLLLTHADHDIDVAVDGRTVTHRRPGMAFTETVFSGREGQFFRHVNTDSWVFVEREGPWHFLGPDDLRSLAEKGTLRLDSGGERALLPRRPESPVQDWSLPALLDFLAVRDLYSTVLDDLSPEYEFWSYGELAPKFLLEYSVTCDLRLPAEFVRFCADYAYRPRHLDWE